MGKPAVFFRRLMDNLHTGARQRGRPEYGAQSVDSLQAIYDLCVEFAPDVAIDVGTAAGASALAIALAMKKLDRLHSTNVSTICKRLGSWSDTLKASKALFNEYELDISEITGVEEDFNILNPAYFFCPYDRPLVSPLNRVVIFYDIHDPAPDSGEAISSTSLLEKWIPQIGEGLVMIHDLWSYPYYRRKMITHPHWGGTVYVGYLECKPIIEWINDCRGTLHEIPEAWIVYFYIKDGKAT